MYLPYKGVSSSDVLSPLPSSTHEGWGLHPWVHFYRMVHLHHHGFSLPMHSNSKGMEFRASRTLYQPQGFFHRKRSSQYFDGCGHLGFTDAAGLETPNKLDPEVGVVLRFPTWQLVSLIVHSCSNSSPLTGRIASFSPVFTVSQHSSNSLRLIPHVCLPDPYSLFHHHIS